MILVIDVGNTNIVLGVYQQKELIHGWRLSTSRDKTADEYGSKLRVLFDYSGINPKDINGVIISSVVPPIMPILTKMITKYFGIEPLVVGPGIKTHIAIKYENPKEVGADRIVNAIAALEIYGGPLIIIDFGTATTFCAISASDEYLGGCIAPGIGISTEALFSRAAKLPRVELVRPKTVIGKNTINSMQSGIIYGFAGQVDGLVERIKREMGGSPKVIATGGLASLIAKESSSIDIVNSQLTLEGLRIIYEMNERNERNK